MPKLKVYSFLCHLCSTGYVLVCNKEIQLPVLEGTFSLDILPYTNGYDVIFNYKLLTLYP